MEESIIKAFDIKQRDVKTYSPLTLAYIGDAVYELVIRTLLVSVSERTTKEYTKRAAEYSMAPTQCFMIKSLLPDLSDEEKAAYRRGKNASPAHVAKSGTPQDYYEATALESLIGWLYVQDKEDRIYELIKLGMERINAE